MTIAPIILTCCVAGLVCEDGSVKPSVKSSMPPIIGSSKPSPARAFSSSTVWGLNCVFRAADIPIVSTAFFCSATVGKFAFLYKSLAMSVMVFVGLVRADLLAVIVIVGVIGWDWYSPCLVSSFVEGVGVMAFGGAGLGVVFVFVVVDAVPPDDGLTSITRVVVSPPLVVVTTSFPFNPPIVLSSVLTLFSSYQRQRGAPR